MPEGFTVHPKLVKQLERRREALARERRGGDEHRLGARRGARVRLAADRGHPDPPDRAGHRARHLQPAPHGPARRQDRPDGLPDPEPARTRWRRWSCTTARCRSSRAWASSTATARRRPRRSCCGRRSSATSSTRAQVIIDQFIVSGPGQVGPDLAPDAAAAPRLRGLGPRALLGAPGALPARGRRGQHPRREPDDPGAVLPPAAPPGAHRQAAPARGHDPQVAAAPGRRRPARSPTWPRARASSRCSPSRACRTSRSRAWCCARARSTTTSSATPSARRTPAWRWRASSCSTRSPKARSWS